MTTQVRDVSLGSSPVDHVAAVQSLTELIRTDGVDMDATRRLPTTIVRALREAGVFRLLAPVEVGGGEIDPVTFFNIVEAASYADGSVGWCVMIGGCYATFAGMLPPEVSLTIYGNEATISAGAFRPDGVAVEVDGGYRVTGRWPLASGSSHATWYVAGCVIVREGDPVIGPTGAPLVREVFVPADVVEIIDTWTSTGLRGTASHDYAVTDVFVPASHTAWFQDPPTIDRPLYRMPPVAMFATFIAGVPLGIARHAIDEFICLADSKTPLRSNTVLSDQPVIQDRLGHAHVMVDAGHRYLRETLNDVWVKVEAGRTPTMTDRSRLWLAATHAAHSALDAIALVYTAAGATGIYSSSPLDRCLRDARTAVQHICTQEVHFELAGRLLLGRDIASSVWAIDDRGVATE